MNVCRYCKFCKMTNVPDTPCVIMDCRLHSKVDPVTGYVSYEDCCKFNSDGKCPDYEEKVSLFKKIYDELRGR